MLMQRIAKSLHPLIGLIKCQQQSENHATTKCSKHHKRPEKDVTYNIVAYRKLSREEMVLAVRHYHMQKKAEKPKKGSQVTIITIIGHNEQFTGSQYK